MTDQRWFTEDDFATLAVWSERSAPEQTVNRAQWSEIAEALRQAAEQAREVERQARVIVGLRRFLERTRDHSERVGRYSSDQEARYCHREAVYTLAELARLEAEPPAEPR